MMSKKRVSLRISLSMKHYAFELEERVNTHLSHSCFSAPHRHIGLHIHSSC